MATIISRDHIDDIVRLFKGKEFTTCEYVDLFCRTFPQDWKTLTDRYGQGGSGNGSPYGPNNYIGIQLKHREKKGQIAFLRWVDSPEGWGNAIVALWRA